MITASVCIENLMWKGSDYKRMKDTIFFNPPVRESGQTKAMFKGINR
jgi:dihydroorotase-like cyclic amidohydrolase